MAWVTPKTNWTAADMVTAGDMNRIEANILEVYNNLRTDSTKALVMEVRTSDPASPVNGQLWFRSDL